MTDAKLELAVPETEREVVRRLPEIMCLHGRVQSSVIDTFMHDIPPYFWLIRASESYHPPDERELGGLWLHTKRVFMAYTILEPSFRELGAIDSFETNCARAACLLHDGFKYGRDPQSQDGDEHEYASGVLSHCPEYTDTSHDLLMASYIRSETELPEEVARCVESHGGSTSWGSHEGRSPAGDLELAVHLADACASNQHHRMPVLFPCNELRGMAPDAPSIEDRDWIEVANEYV